MPDPSMHFTDEFIKRFKARLRESANGCLLWTGATDRKGYGAISFCGQMLKAHRVAFFLEHGRWPEPSGLHACDTPACVRVGEGHVFEGTAADNSADMVSKGRHRVGVRYRGEENQATRIDVDSVRLIRALRIIGIRVSTIADRIGISKGQVRNILSQKHWGWVS